MICVDQVRVMRSALVLRRTASRTKILCNVIQHHADKNRIDLWSDSLLPIHTCNAACSSLYVALRGLYKEASPPCCFIYRYPLTLERQQKSSTQARLRYITHSDYFSLRRCYLEWFISLSPKSMNMRTPSFTAFILFAMASLAISLVNGYAFTPTRLSYGSIQNGSDFVVSQRPKVNIVRPQQKLQRHNATQMGSQAKFGIFSPAVYVAKLALGDKKLNSIRGKAISLHSQAIGEFCEWAGAYHLRTRLIKKAKTNGDSLGFLV